MTSEHTSRCSNGVRQSIILVHSSTLGASASEAGFLCLHQLVTRVYIIMTNGSANIAKQLWFESYPP